MVERAIILQRERGTIVELVTKLDEPAARAIGLWGEGDITLRLEPCIVPEQPARPGPLPPLPSSAYAPGAVPLPPPPDYGHCRP